MGLITVRGCAGVGVICSTHDADNPRRTSSGIPVAGFHSEEFGFGG